MRFVLPTLAVISLLIGVILLTGCFVRLKLDTDVARRNGPHRDLNILLDGGRVGIEIYISPRPSPNDWLDFRIDPLRVRVADTKRLLWEFRLRTFPGQAVQVEFPCWVALLPCFVAPVLWMRRRRQCRRPARGFAVLNPK